MGKTNRIQRDIGMATTTAATALSLASVKMRRAEGRASLQQ